ncbi:MAG: D-glycero-D-manno-heptose 1,7-bisphosphate phosphatase, partial [Pseudohongiellaceae bacterium]
LIDAIEQALNCSANGAFIVGDSLRDLEAGLVKSCIPLLVKTGKGARTLDKLTQQPQPSLKNLLVFDDLAASCDFLIEQLKP